MPLHVSLLYCLNCLHLDLDERQSKRSDHAHSSQRLLSQCPTGGGHACNRPAVQARPCNTAVETCYERSDAVVGGRGSYRLSNQQNQEQYQETDEQVDSAE